MKRRRQKSWGRLTPQGRSSFHDDGPYTLAEGVAPARSDVASAWLQTRLLPSPKGATLVGSVIPAGFEAYARVFHPARLVSAPSDRGRVVPWKTVAEWSGRVAHPQMQWDTITRPRVPVTNVRPWNQDPIVGQLPRDTREALVDILAAHTSTPDLCWFCIWNGYGEINELSDLPRVELPERVYFLLTGPLKSIRTEGLFVGSPSQLGPNIWWAEDRAWCVATEIDFRFTYVGGSAKCIDQLLWDDRLEAMPADARQRADYLGDSVNISAL